MYTYMNNHIYMEVWTWFLAHLRTISYQVSISMNGWQIGLSHQILKSSRILEKLHWCVQILTGKTHVKPLLNVWILIQRTCACLQCMGHCKLMIRKSACLQHFIACLVFTWMYPCWKCLNIGALHELWAVLQKSFLDLKLGCLWDLPSKKELSKMY